jgi:plasmid stability protein
MPSLTVKNIPDDLYDMLKHSAAANRRSLNSQILTCIEMGVRGRKINAEDLLAQARKLRRETRNHPLTDRKFRAAKLAARP